MPPGGKSPSIEIGIEPHAGIRALFALFAAGAGLIDRLSQRCWLFVPLWNIPTYFCTRHGGEVPEDGVVVEHIPVGATASVR